MFVSYYSKLGFKLFSTRNVTRNICEDRKKKKAFNNRLYKNIKTFRKQPFGNFSAFHWSTIPFYQHNRERPKIEEKFYIYARPCIIFCFLCLCYDCSTSVINALVNFTRCFLRRKWENTLNLRINPVNLRLLYLRNSGEFGRLNDWYICLLFLKICS